MKDSASYYCQRINIIMKIKGKVAYQDLGTGFWGIISDSGEKYKPVNFPKELEKEGLSVKITAKEARGTVSIFMWGTSVEITDYSIG